MRTEQYPVDIYAKDNLKLIQPERFQIPARLEYAIRKLVGNRNIGSVEPIISYREEVRETLFCLS